jgi:hypothetical protein
LNERNTATILLATSLAFVVILCLTAAVCGVLGAIQATSSGSVEALTSVLLFVVGILWCSLLLAPTIWYAIQRLRGQPDQPGPFSTGRSAWLPYWLMLLAYPLVLLTGSLAFRAGWLAGWVFPLLQIPAATLPVFWLSGMALRGLASDSRLQRWGIFGLGLTLSPALIMVVELGVIAVLVLVFAIRIGSDQSRLFELMLLAQRLQYAEADPEAIFAILEPFLLQPGFLIVVFGFVAILVPLVEEALKPAGVWLLAGREPNPAQGFAAGVLSGAGYALFENLFITAPGEQWALISIGRIGTTTMHILTAGMTGYALAGAWSRGRYLRLAVIFGVAVLIHALWNGLTLFSVASAVSLTDPISQRLGGAEQAGVIILFALYLALFAGLILANRRLRRYAIIPPLAVLPQEAMPDSTEGESDSGPLS